MLECGCGMRWEVVLLHFCYKYSYIVHITSVPITLLEWKATMGKNKQVSCKICYKTMRSDHLNRHMKVHVKRNEIHPTTKIQYNEIDVSALRKMLEKETVRYKNKISLGKALDKILDEGKVMEVVLTSDMQNALNLYRNNMCVEVEKR